MKDEKKSRETLLQELAEMRQRLAHLEEAERSRARVDALLGALNQAALAMGKVLTPDAIFDAMAAELDPLGYSCMIFPFDEDRKNMGTTFVSMQSKLLRAVEKMAGAQGRILSLPVERLEQIEIFQQVVRGRETVFASDLEGPLAQALPGPARPVMKRIARMLNLYRTVVAPLVIEDEVIGILVVQSDDLGREDIPAVGAFSHQVAAAWRKAELFEQAQQEIAERMRAEGESRRLREFNEGIIQQMAEGITVQDVEGRFSFVNPAAAAMLGYEIEDLLGRSEYDVISPEQVQILEAADRRRMQGQSDQYELELKRVDGSGVPVLISGSPRWDPVTGEFAGTLAVFTDLSEHRRAQEQLQATSRLLQIIYDTIPDAVISVDDEDTIMACNPAVERVLGYSTEELIGQNYSCLVPEQILDDPGDQKRRELALSQSGFLTQEDFFFKKKNGQVFPASFSVGLVRDQEGKVLGQVGSIRDVTKRKRAERLLESLDRAALAMEKALTPDEIFGAVAEILGEMGIDCSLFPYNENQRSFNTRYVSYGSKLLRAAEKMAGVSHEDFFIPIETLEKMGLFHRIIRDREVVLQKDMAEVLRQILPSPGRLLARQIVQFLQVSRVIIAPLVVEDRVIGIFMVQSDGLGEEDVPAFSTLAHLVAAAWRRAELFEQAQQEIVERRRVEAALRESEERYRQLIEMSPDAIMMADLEGTVITANQRSAQLLGFESSQELVGRNAVEFFLEEDTALVQRYLRLIRRAGPIRGMRFIAARRDGHRFPVELSTSLVLDTEGQPARLVTVVHDIAERVQAEEERERLLAEIQTQAQRLQVSIDAVPEGVLLLDADSRPVLANPVAEGYLEILAERSAEGCLVQLGGRPLADLLEPPPARMWHELEQGGRAFELASRPIEVGPSTGGWVLVIREVTQEREEQERMQQHERLAAVGQLAAGIAHDFNNIMAVIVLYSQMSLQMAELPPRVRERLRTVEQQAKRATDLIQQILDFSRRAVLERRPLDLVPLIKEEVKLLERALPENIRIRLGYGVEDYTVNADPTRMQQAIMNLAVNARDAMPEGGELRLGLRRVTVLPQQRPPLPEMEAGEWVLMTVADNGTGIPEEALPHIFEPFYTTKAVGEGSGLGLAQVYGIVRQHGGSVGVETKLEQGSVFSIYLPALAVSKSSERLAELLSLTPGRGELILVAEDHAPTRKALLSCLEELNYQVLTAANGREALEIYQQHREGIALVITDMVMPEMGGQVLSGLLHEQFPEVKVVVVTGYPLESDSEALTTPGVVGWMQKPIGVNDLAQMVRQVLG